MERGLTERLAREVAVALTKKDAMQECRPWKL